MPSPFPGMDPFLERPDIFPDFHDGFVVLPSGIDPGDSAESRGWPPTWSSACRPRRALLGSARNDAGEKSGPAVAVASPPLPQPLVVHVPHDARRETLVEVYCRARVRGPDRRAVTKILAARASRQVAQVKQGRDLYLRKQREILDSKVHLVEINLLRGGEHTTAVPRSRLARAAGEFEYHVSIHHFDNWEDYFVHVVRLNQPLPQIAVPLLPGDPPVLVDLQAVFQRTYTAVPTAAKSTTDKTRRNYRWGPHGSRGFEKSWTGRECASCKR